MKKLKKVIGDLLTKKRRNKERKEGLQELEKEYERKMKKLLKNLLQKKERKKENGDKLLHEGTWKGV